MAKQTDKTIKKISSSLMNNMVKHFSLNIISDICTFQDSMRRINNVAEGKDRYGNEVYIPWQLRTSAMYKFQDYMFQTMNINLEANTDSDDGLQQLSDESLQEKIEAMKTTKESEDSVLEVNPEIDKNI